MYNAKAQTQNTALLLAGLLLATPALAAPAAATSPAPGPTLQWAHDHCYQAEEGLMDSDLWTGWEYQARVYLTAPGVQEYWDQRQSAFSERFRRWVNSMDGDDTYKRVSELASSAYPTDRESRQSPA